MSNQQIFLIQPPERLSARVLDAVKQDAAKRAKRRMIIYSTVLMAVFFLLVLASADFWIEFRNSGFKQYITLALSDWRLLMSYLPDYLLALLESFPAVQFALSMLLATSLLTLMRKIFKEAKILNHLRYEPR